MPSTDDLRAERQREFGRRLRELRKAQDLTQESVALAAGLDRSFYVEVENAKHSVDVTRVWAIADALGVSTAELFNGPEFRPTTA